MKRRTFIQSAIGTAFYFGFSDVLPTVASTLQFNDNEILGIGPPVFCDHPYLLRCEVAEAFEAMKAGAEKEGLRLWCTSGYRNFNYQKGMWNFKYKQFAKSFSSPYEIIAEITKYTALPGTSRHHWGTDLDITDALGYQQIGDALKTEYFKEGGEYQFLGYWLKQNAHKYGFYEAYTDDPARTGFRHEPWHYSYAPLAKPMLSSLLKIDLAAVASISKCDGYKYFTQNFLGTYFKNYVLGINPLLLP